MTFTDIKTYFQANLRQSADLPWDSHRQLSPLEQQAVRSSLQTFQRGEGTGGDHLMALARQWPVADYTAAMQLFIQEEEGHAEMLGKFLDQQGIPRLQTHWLHEIFRGLGRPLGLAHMVQVILTAEVVATVYYRALLRATDSDLLQQICRRILQDEKMHLAFHCLAIRQLTAGRSRAGAWFWRQVYRGLMAGTALILYTASRRTFRAGGYGLASFCAAIGAEYAQVEQMLKLGTTLSLHGVTHDGDTSQLGKNEALMHLPAGY